jgi:hypothetical protein
VTLDAIYRVLLGLGAVALIIGVMIVIRRSHGP